MEKTDLVIALAGAAVLVVAVTASAVYGGTGAGGDAFSVAFPAREAALEPQTFQTQGSGEAELTFDVPHANVTSVTFDVAASGPGNQASPSVRITVTNPAGEEFSADGASITVPVQEAPAAFEARAASADAVATPPPSNVGAGTWTVLVQVTSPTPLPVPYAVSVSGTVAHYEAEVKPKLPETSR